MPNLGDRIEVIGMGKMFLAFIPGATGFGEVVHIGTHGETESSEKFTERERYELLSPSQFGHGIFYIDEGIQKAVWLAHGDYRIAEEEVE